MSESLETIRQEIDAVDRKMAALFERRLQLVEQVAEYKFTNNEKIFDPEREAQVIEKNAARLKNAAYREDYTAFMHAVMDQSKAIQKKWIDAQKKK